MKKSKIVIYLIGVALAWIMGFNNTSNLNKELNRKLTYGDIGFVTSISLFSWASVIALCIVEVTELDIWDQPICPASPNEPRPPQVQ